MNQGESRLPFQTSEHKLILAISYAEIESELDAMTLPEKLHLMEALWANLSRREESLASPARHEDVLRERQARVKSGEAAFVDWETAKQQLRERLKSESSN